MSFKEKSAWVMGALLCGAGLYYLFIAVAVSSELGRVTPPAGIFVPFTMLIVIASVVAQAIMATLAPKEANRAADERERPILDRAGHWSGLVLGAGIIVSLLHFLFHQGGALFFHMVMASLILSQIAEYAFQIALIRRVS